MQGKIVNLIKIRCLYFKKISLSGESLSSNKFLNIIQLYGIIELRKIYIKGVPSVLDPFSLHYDITYVKSVYFL